MPIPRQRNKIPDSIRNGRHSSAVPFLCAHAINLIAGWPVRNSIMKQTGYSKGIEQKRKYTMLIFMAVIGAFGILGVVIADTQSRPYSFLGYLLGSFFGC